MIVFPYSQGWFENNQWLTLIGQNLTKKSHFWKKKIKFGIVLYMILLRCDGSRIIEIVFRRYLGKYDIKWVINTSISWPFLAHISIYHPIWQRIPKSKLHIITMGNLESLVVLLACIYAFWWFNTIEWGRRSWCYSKIFYFRTSRQTSKKYEFTLIGQNLTKKVIFQK